MRAITPDELREADSTIIIPTEVWATLPRSVTDLLYGYIGIPVSNGKMTGYKFSNVPQYLIRELEAAYKK